MQRRLAKLDPPRPPSPDDLARAGAFLDGHLARLRALPAHGNRVLRYDQLLLGLLLAFYDPAVRSLRLIEGSGDFGGRLDLPRLARSTTADALAVLDPAHLRPLIADLRARAGDLRGADATLAGIAQRIIAGDGTYLNTLADVAWALRQTRRDGTRHAQVRLNVQLDVAAWAPQVVSVSGDDGSEPSAFAADLLPDVLYVLDRNFLDFAFLGQVLARGSNFVLRVRSNAPAATVVRALPVTGADAAAGVASDQIVTLAGRGAPPGAFRLVTIVTVNRRGAPETIRLLTSLADGGVVSARVVGEAYRLRWQVELFFKWLKTWARLDHLLGTTRNAITFQFYAAVIGVLTTCLATGRRVSRYALHQLRLLAHGQVTFDQAMATLALRERERQQDRARAAARRASEKLV